MTDDGLLTGPLNPALFTALGIAIVVAGVTLSDGWFPLAVGAVIVAGGVATLAARQLGVSGRKSAVPMIVSGFVLGGLFVWNGYSSGTPLWIVFGLGLSAAMALTLWFPDRGSLRTGVLASTFGLAGVVVLTAGDLFYGAVHLAWAAVFGRMSYRARNTASTTAD